MPLTSRGLRASEKGDWAVGGRGNPACVPSAGTVQGPLKAHLPLMPAFYGAHPAGDVKPVGTEPATQGRQALKSQGTCHCLCQAAPFRKAGRGGSGLGAFASKGIRLRMAVPRTELGRNAHPRPISSRGPSARPGAVRAVCDVGEEGLLDHRYPATGNQHPSDSSGKACWTSVLKAENPRGGKGSVEAPSPTQSKLPRGPESAPWAL